MTVRVNLLPEARVLKIKNQQTKRLVTLLCVIVAVGVGATLLVLLLILGARTIQSNLNQDKIKELKGQIEAKKNTEEDTAWFNTALNESARLSDNRILISQLFDRLTEALPQKVTLTDITVDPDYKVTASVEAPDFNTVALFGNALSTYNVSNRPITGFERKEVFKDIVIDSVTNGKGTQSINTKLFDVTFSVDKDLVKKFREDSKTPESAGGSNGS